MTSSQKQLAVELSLLSIAIIWALNFSIIKIALEEFDPLSFNAMRFTLSSILIWIIVLKRGLRVNVPKKDWLKILGMGLLGSFVYQGLFIIGIDYTYSANAAVMLGTIPIWVGVFSHLFTSDKLSSFKGLGVLLGFLGVLVIILGGDGRLDFSSDSFLGDIIIVLAAMVWAGYTLLSKPMLNKYPPIVYSALMSTVGGFALIVAGIPPMTQLPWTEISWAAWGGLLYSGLLAIGAAYIIWNYGIQTVGAVRTATYQNLVPVLGLIFGVVLMGDPLGWLQYLGSAAVIFGIIITRRPDKSEKK
ncbi:MAG: DMT family transporter [Bacteroidota bacterium]